MIYLKKDSPEYSSLQDGDKTALKYLVKAAAILDEIFLRLDNVHNVPFKKFLESEIKNAGNATNTTNFKQANLTKILFDSFKGINGFDSQGNEVNLAKNHNTSVGLGLGFYPEDLTKEKFHEILFRMLNENKIEEVRNITNQRTIVQWDKNKTYLTSIDYVEYFKDNFTKVADLLINASKCSSNDTFNNFLILQAEALKTADPKLDAKADKVYVELQNTPLELTLVREGYEELTISTLYNRTLRTLLRNNEITPVSKDALGLRVGIVNKAGTALLSKLKENIPLLAQQMPLYNKYKENTKDEDIYKNTTMVDVDIIKLAGFPGAYRGDVNDRELLPNEDKLSVIETGKQRFVFHRQLRNLTYKYQDDKKKAQELLNSTQAELFDDGAFSLFYTVKDIAQQFGPRIGKSNISQDYLQIL